MKSSYKAEESGIAADQCQHGADFVGQWINCAESSKELKADEMPTNRSFLAFGIRRVGYQRALLVLFGVGFRVEKSEVSRQKNFKFFLSYV